MGQHIDIEALASLFQHHYGLMVSVAVRFAPSPDLVYDIIQQVFIDYIEYVLKEKRDFQEEIVPLLKTFTRNRAIDYWRERKKNSPEQLQRIVKHFIARRDDGESPWKEDTVALRACLKKLPPKIRQMIQQHYFDGVSMENIARQTESKVTTIRSTFCRIRQKLRDCINRKTGRPDR